MENLNEEVGTLIDGILKDSIVDSNQTFDRDLEKDNHVVMQEDLDGLQMLRLAQEDNEESLKEYDKVSSLLEESRNQQNFLFNASNNILPMEGNKFNIHECFQATKPLVERASHISKDNIALENLKLLEEDNIDINQKISELEHEEIVEKNDIEVKLEVVKKKVKSLERLMDEQNKTFQDFHVKFSLEGIDIECDGGEAKASTTKCSEFAELKKRLEEEEKLYASCALSEHSDMDQVDGLDSSAISFRNLNSLEPAHVAAKAAMDGVINSFADIAICHQNSNFEDVENMKLQNITYAMKDHVDHVDESQEYTPSQYCCQKAGKQIDDGNKSDVYMTNSTYSMLNVVCPISGMPVIELDDPVRSEECEHIYDRASVLNYIENMSKDGFCLCASEGCHALLVKNKLVVDNRLWQDIKELRQIKASIWENRMLQDYMNIDDSDDD